ncbi:MAG: 16S rRNA (cytidine(1402)-2'-O)-methyltransferase [Clostridium sp.]|nr:16S rRNA (cytidine(1402)-2'-O)-methyltransferase [Clostridium sp.]
MNKKGTLYIVATPIGNLEDITQRALKVLGEVDLIAAEDTRRTLKLLNYFNIKGSLTSYYEHNKIAKGNLLIERLLQGDNVALVCDAGTPGISDPGEDIVRLCIENSISVTAIPGPVAAICGLILSGLPTGRFVFEGFLPTNKRQKRERISLLKEETRTTILYEAPHKLKHTLKDLNDILGNRNIVLARELTKRYEEVIRCSLKEAVERYNHESPRGEYILIIEGADGETIRDEKNGAWENISIKEHYEIYLSKGFVKKEAMRKVAQDRGISRREVYKELI